MGVRINESWHHYPSGGIDLDGIARLDEIFDAAARSHFDQNSIAN